jgi:hypothetical protein
MSTKAWHMRRVRVFFDSVGQWYFGQKNSTSRRFSSVLRSLARHVDRKMTIVVPVVPFTNRV